MRTLFASLVVLLACVPTPTKACQCVIDIANDVFDESPHVFVARILEVSDAATESGLSNKSNARATHHLGARYGRRMRFAIEATIKGKPESLAQLATGYGGGDCGVSAVQGTYLVVATDQSGEISYCGIGEVLRLDSCGEIEWLDRLRRRARDGVTDVNFDRLRYQDANPSGLRKLIAKGRNPFSITTDDCPVLRTPNAERRAP